MSKKLMKTIQEIIKTSGSNKITVFTQHLKIDGEIFVPEGKCEECNDDYLTLRDALVCRIKDYCECTDDVCECHDYACFRYGWLNICTEKIVAFSIV